MSVTNVCDQACTDPLCNVWSWDWSTFVLQSFQSRTQRNDGQSDDEIKVHFRTSRKTVKSTCCLRTETNPGASMCWNKESIQPNPSDLTKVTHCWEMRGCFGSADLCAFTFKEVWMQQVSETVTRSWTERRIRRGKKGSNQTETRQRKPRLQLQT